MGAAKHRTAASVLSQGEDLDWRDKGMANNLLWIMQQNPDARIAIWAHNAHISRSQSRTSSSRPMGAFLKDSLADDFRSFGFVCFEGEFTAKKGPQYFPAILKPEPGTLEYLLEQLNEPQFILNLKKCAKKKHTHYNGSTNKYSEQSEQIPTSFTTRVYPTCSII